MSDHVETFLKASCDADMPTLLGTLAPEAQLDSPLAGDGVFRGVHDLEILLTAVYTSLRGLVWEEHYREGTTHTVIGRARVLGVELTDAMLLDTDEQGRIVRIRPHLRPWAALSAFAVAIGPKLARHPDLLRRSLTASKARKSEDPNPH